MSGSQVTGGVAPQGAGRAGACAPRARGGNRLQTSSREDTAAAGRAPGTWAVLGVPERAVDLDGLVDSSWFEAWELAVSVADVQRERAAVLAEQDAAEAAGEVPPVGAPGPWELADLDGVVGVGSSPGGAEREWRRVETLLERGGPELTGPAEWYASGAVDGSAERPAWWFGADPGPVLAQVLDDMDYTTLSDFALVEAVAAASRMESWAHALSTAAAFELTKRPGMAAPTAPVAQGLMDELDVPGEEVSMRLGISRRAGKDVVARGRAFAHHLAPTGDALEAGCIDPGKARLLVDALEHVHPALALGVQELVLPDAPGRTHHQLRQDITDALVQVDPEEAASCAKAARATRAVHTPKPLANGMAGIWAVLPAAQAVAAYNTLDAAARAARRAGDVRTLDQLRADTLIGAITHPGMGAGTVPGAGVGDSTSSARHSASIGGTPGCGPGCPGIEIRVVVPLSTLLGTSDEPAHLDGYGTIDPDTARALATGGTWRRLVTDPTTGAVLDVGRTRYRPPAALADHVRARDVTCVHPRCSTPATRCDLDHTIPWVWATGADRDTLSDTNQSAPSDTDQEAPPGGTTSHDNLGALSRRCHVLRTHGPVTLTQDAPGRFTWTMPSGHVYTREPTGPVPSRRDIDQTIAPARAETAYLSGHGDLPPPF